MGNSRLVANSFKHLRGQSIGAATTRTKWMFRNLDYLKAFSKFSQVKLALGRVNLLIAGIDINDHLFTLRVSEFNSLALLNSKARWHASIGIVTRDKAEWKIALSTFTICLQKTKQLLKLLEAESAEPLGMNVPSLSPQGTEIEFFGEAPIVPEVCPVITIKGSSYEMGYQYAQQLVKVFGSWILEKKTGRTFTEEAMQTIREWEKQMQEHTPEIIEMCKGWVAGANNLEIPMSYNDVLEIWTGHVPPRKTYLGRGDTISDAPPPIACAGVGAWGKATTDGELVTGSSGDHDPSFPVTIMAYPDTGNNFMYTTFSAVGDITLVGSQHMFGFPGINNKGLAYIEHGGQPRSIEPKEYWGYGLRRAASVLHILRFANSAEEARNMEKSWPVGDAGMDNGTIGGFFADKNYGYVLESRKEPVICRESGDMGEEDFMYANNSAIHKDASQAGWMKLNQKTCKDWEWDEHGGWHPKNVKGFTLTSLFRSGEAQAAWALRGMYAGSRKRNLYSFNMLNKAKGKIDINYMKKMFRSSAKLPEKPWKELDREYKKLSKWGQASIGNASNGIITITKPANGNMGIYSVCVGKARRGVNPNSPFLASFCPMYNESNAFWELQLSDSPGNAVKYAQTKAEEYIKTADNDLNSKNNKITDPASHKYLEEILNNAKTFIESGVKCLNTTTSMNTNTNNTGYSELYKIAEAIRWFIKAQVKAQMVSELITPSEYDELSWEE